MYTPSRPDAFDPALSDSIFDASLWDIFMESDMQELSVKRIRTPGLTLLPPLTSPANPLSLTGSDPDQPKASSTPGESLPVLLDAAGGMRGERS